MNPKSVTTKGMWIKVFVKALPNTIIKFSDKPSWSETFCRFYPFIAESFVNLRHPTFVRMLTCNKLIHIIIL